MKSARSHGWLAVAVLALASAAAAQSPLPPAPLAVKGIPYTGIRRIDANDVLADGTLVPRQTVVETARDSEGRTWSHTHIQSEEHGIRDLYNIYNPAARILTSWCGTCKIAYVRHYGESKEPSPPANGSSLMRDAPSLPEPGSDPATPEPRTGTEGERHSTRLPPQEILGFQTRGMHVVRNFTVGSGDHAAHYTSTVDSWYSPELHLALHTLIDDPFRGKSDLRFTKIDRNEPDPSLFQPPANMPLRDAPLPRPSPGK